MTADLMIQIGDRTASRAPVDATQVRVPARFSADGRKMIAAIGPGGWFGQAAILAERVGSVWVSRLEYPLRVTAERRGDRWERVRDGHIGTARPIRNAANEMRRGRR